MEAEDSLLLNCGLSSVAQHRERDYIIQKIISYAGVKMSLKSGLMENEAVLTILKEKFGHSRFRSEEQKKAIMTLIKGGQDVFVSMPTGSGQWPVFGVPATTRGCRQPQGDYRGVSLGCLDQGPDGAPGPDQEEDRGSV